MPPSIESNFIRFPVVTESAPDTMMKSVRWLCVMVIELRNTVEPDDPNRDKVNMLAALRVIPLKTRPVNVKI